MIRTNISPLEEDMMEDFNPYQYEDILANEGTERSKHDRPTTIACDHAGDDGSAVVGSSGERLTAQLTPEQEERFDQKFIFPSPMSGLRFVFRVKSGEIVSGGRATPAKVKQHMAEEIERAVREERERILTLLYENLRWDENVLSGVIGYITEGKINKLLAPTQKENTK